jgi:hypothetical protein
VETACKPFQEGIHYLAETFQKAIHYPFANSKRDWIAACNKPYLHVAIHRPFTIFRIASTTFLKIRKKQLNKLLTMKKQLTRQKTVTKSAKKEILSKKNQH